MQEMVIQGKRLNYSQTKVSNALAVTEVHVGHVRYTFPEGQPMSKQIVWQEVMVQFHHEIITLFTTLYCAS